MTAMTVLGAFFRSHFVSDKFEGLNPHRAQPTEEGQNIILVPVARCGVSVGWLPYGVAWRANGLVSKIFIHTFISFSLTAHTYSQAHATPRAHTQQ